MSASLTSLVWAVANLLLLNVFDLIPSVPGFCFVFCFLREPWDVALEMKQKGVRSLPPPTRSFQSGRGSRHLGFSLQPISLVQRMELSFLYLQHPASSPTMEKYPLQPPHNLELVSVASSDLSSSCALAIPAPSSNLGTCRYHYLSLNPRGELGM